MIRNNLREPEREAEPDRTAVPPNEPAAAPASRRSSPADFWVAIARERYLPSIVRKFAMNRFSRRSMAHHELTSVGQDRTDDVATRLPDGEQVRMPALWIVELYTPTTINNLLKGLPKLLDKQKGPRRDDDLVQWVRDRRRSGGPGFHSVPVVRSRANGPLGTIVTRLPPGIESIKLEIQALTSSVTAVSAEFHLQPDYSQALELSLSQDLSTRLRRRRGGYSLQDVQQRKAHAAETWRRAVRADATKWLASRLPGYFARSDSGQLPTFDLILTEQQRPWEAASERGPEGWRQSLGFTARSGYWQCGRIPALRLVEGRSGVSEPQTRHLVTIGALRAEFHGAFRDDGPGADDLDAAIRAFGEDLTLLTTRWALTALLREVDEHLAAQPDLAALVSTSRSPWKLNRVQRSVTHTALDGRVVVNDIVKYAEDGTWWKSGILDFDFDATPAAAPTSPGAQPASLVELLRKAQIDDGKRIAEKEAQLREILGVSTDLRATSLSLSLQWIALTIAAMAVIVGAVAARATIKAIPQPTTTPSPQSSIGSPPATHSPQP